MSNLVVRAGQRLRGFVSKAIGGLPMTVANTWALVREPFSGAWQRNMELDNKECVMAFSAPYACYTRIANDISKLRPMLVDAQPNGIKVEITRNSPFNPVLRKPNKYQNRIQFLKDWVLMKLLYGNTYVLKQRDQRGIVTSMFVLDSRRVRPMVTPDGGVYYQISNDYLAGIENGVTVPASEIIHDRGPTLWHTLCGVPPIYAFAASATQGNRIQANSAKFFENMSRPSGVLSAPGTIKQETADRLKTEWERNFTGSNIGRLAVLGDGLTYEAMTIPAQTAQLIEQLRWTVEDVARACAMPLYKIGAGAVPTSNNVEALQQQYYDDCLQIYIEEIEACLNEGLELPVGTEVQLDLTGLLRMDSATQITMLKDAVLGGLMKPNEGRARMNLGPVAGGDDVYLQEQNYSLSALAKRDAKADPFGSAATLAASSSTAALPAPEPEPDDPVPDDTAKFVDALIQRFMAVEHA